MRSVAFAFSIALLGSPAFATPVSGKVELPPAPKLPPHPVKGFTDRVENPNKPVRDQDVAPYLLIVLEGGAKPEAPPQVSWDLVGESFARPVVGAAVGAEVVIKNCAACRARTLRALEDPKLLPPGPINPTGPKSFRANAPGVYTIGDADAPHLVGKVVVVATSYIAHVEVVNGVARFELPDVAEGSYKLRVFYKTGWIDRSDDTVTVPAKGKLEVPVVKIPAGYPVKK